MTLILWRHGQTDYNATHRFQGQLDVPLNQVGRDQAAHAARYLAALKPDAIFSSDLSRASQTADALARLTGLSVKPEPDLRERFGGEWEGLSNTQMREGYPEQYARWEPPGGETASQVADRSSAAMERIAESMAPGSVAVLVSHGACLGIGLGRLLGIADGSRVLGPFGNCHWSVVSQRGSHWRVLEHNVGWLPEPVPDPEDAGAVEAEPDDA